MPKYPELTLPNFFIPGAGKSGTSSLHSYLAQNDDVYMSDPKEIHFFSNPELFELGASYYARFFEAAQGAPVRGESSTTYLFLPGVVERILDLIPQAKFIFILRNPVDRIISHYRWLWGLGLEDRPLKDAVESDRFDQVDFSRRIQGNKFRFYFAESCYGRYVGSYIDAFGPHQALIVTTEQLSREPAAVLARCCRFLGVRPSAHVDPIWVNQTPETVDAPFSVDDRRWLVEQLSSDVALLRSRTGNPFSEWAEDFPEPSTAASSADTSSASKDLNK